MPMSMAEMTVTGQLSAVGRRKSTFYTAYIVNRFHSLFHTVHISPDLSRPVARKQEAVAVQ